MNWKAGWIYDKKEFEYEKQCVLFRKRFHLETVPEKAEVMVSADSRYRLFVNGELVLNGPLKGDKYRHYFETFDITSLLRKGGNTLAAQVLHFGADYYGEAANFSAGPISVISGSRGGFILHAEALAVDTDESWKVRRDPSYHFVYSVDTRYAGDMEYVDGRACLNGWEQPEYDDSDWDGAVLLGTSDSYNYRGGLAYEWQLTGRDIPNLYETAVYPVRISRQSGGTDFGGIVTGAAVTVPAHTECCADIDMGELSTCYLKLRMDRGAGAALTLLYSECYCRLDEKTGAKIKEDRNDSRTGDLYGEEDRYIKGEGAQWYRPFFFRTFRYLRIKVKTGDEPLIINGAEFYMTGYPLTIETALRAENNEVQQMWDISVRTLKRCMHETYEDCPYYEQMQYLMDTDIQMALSYCLSGDDRLARKALLDFHSSQRPDGMLLCNSPASFNQIIPGFALFFPDMVLRHYRYFGDRKVLEFYLPTIMRILGYFEEKLCSRTGLVKDPGFWVFVDWVNEWRVNFGSPVGADEPYCYIYSEMYAWGLLNTAAICRELGYGDLERKYKTQHIKMTEALNSQAVDPVSGLYLAKPDDQYLSQHAQLWAVLSECATGDRAKEIMRACLNRKDLLVCSYSMSFFLFRALEKAGVYQESGPVWEQWKCLLGLNITTWPEDNVGQRSECHAWSAGAIYEITGFSLGIRPEGAGFEVIRIEPCEFELGDMEAEVWTKQGIVKVSRRIWTENGRKKAHFNYRFPKAVPVHVTAPNGEFEKVTESVELEFEV